jgi:hypothetical protein
MTNKQLARMWDYNNETQNLSLDLSTTYYEVPLTLLKTNFNITT